MIKKGPLLLIILFSFICSQVSCQVDKARKQMQVYNYSEAIRILHKTIQRSDSIERKEAIVLLADCYRMQNDMITAEQWYSRAVDEGVSSAEVIFNYAFCLRSCGEYRMAKEMFLRYAALQPGDPSGKIFAGYCDSVNKWKIKPPSAEIRNVKELNSEESDFGPVIFDHKLLFTSDRPVPDPDKKTYGWTGNGPLTIYIAEPGTLGQYSGNYKNPMFGPGPFNEGYHNGPATFDRSCGTAYITKTFFSRDKTKKNDERIGTHLLKIYSTHLENGKWSKQQPFFLNSEEYSVGHPALDTSGQTLFFASDMPGGLGGTDLYQVTMKDGGWGSPVNLGPDINTFGNEMFPFMADNGDLYYASTGLPGYGGLDIFVTRFENGKWTRPQNLGEPVNSSFDDFSIYTSDSGNAGLFSSNRPGGLGSDDIYSFRKIKPVIAARPIPCFLAGCVKDKTTGEPIAGGTVFILDNRSGKVLISVTNSAGCFRVKADPGHGYTVKAMKTGYIADCLPDSVPPGIRDSVKQLPRFLLLDRLAVNRVFKIENIYYDFDKWNIRPNAQPPLDNLVMIMKENPITVELGSHTDCRGTDAYNEILSQKRAESAVRYIISHGIDPSRITAKGYGEYQPVVKCPGCMNCTKEEHQLNRRTEFKVLSSSVPEGKDTFDPGRYHDGESVDIKALPENFFDRCR